MLRAILFDFNGILVDDEPLHFRLFQKVLGEEGLELTEREYYAKYLGFDDRACFHAVLTAAGQTPDLGRLMRLIVRKSSYYQETVRREGYPFFPGAVELVRAAAAAGLMLGIVSGALREEVEGALTQEGLLSLFKVLVTAEDVRASKPDPHGYQLGLQGLNAAPPLPDRLIHPHEVLAIEDSPAGLEAAAKASLRTVGVAQSYPAEQLTAADGVARSVAELSVDWLRGI